MISLADIEAAARWRCRVKFCARRCCRRLKLSEATGAEVFVKYENLQVTNSFMNRGAFIKLQSLTPEERARGVVAMSAGNHAQAVAYHAPAAGHRRDHCDAGDDPVREG